MFGEFEVYEELKKKDITSGGNVMSYIWLPDHVSVEPTPVKSTLAWKVPFFGQKTITVNITLQTPSHLQTNFHCHSKWRIKNQQQCHVSGVYSTRKKQNVQSL